MSDLDSTARSPRWGKARFKLFFGGKGTVVRVTTVQSSGSSERDKECIAWCWTRTIPIVKKGVRTNAQWFILDIDAGAVLEMPKH
ncbi:hypothetical protein [Paraburkholderia antibiotica]|uniref:Uncharacterized protein n=1 Tax=Paraburkholderia antibiotica TaxID=2728839 RepID=A0A7Y0FFY2_9BURK|nr:hypothetical protein [Paraburkholderia antibiotica]NML34651.1 hypothetical protein [Paraburkholderia antibiotica]